MRAQILLALLPGGKPPGSRASAVGYGLLAARKSRMGEGINR